MNEPLPVEDQYEAPKENKVLKPGTETIADN